MEFELWVLIIPACLIVTGMVLRRPLRMFAEDRVVHQARLDFRYKREGLEARFLAKLASIDPGERSRWGEAQWGDDVVWARDRRSGTLLALVAVRFLGAAYDEFGEPCPRHATVLFEYRQRRWHAEGLRLIEVRPDEAIFRNRRLVPVFVPPTWG